MNYYTMLINKADLPKVRAWFVTYEIEHSTSCTGNVAFVTYKTTNELNEKFLEWFSRETEARA